jgi:hypothetical protein
MFQRCIHKYLKMRLKNTGLLLAISNVLSPFELTFPLKSTSGKKNGYVGSPYHIQDTKIKVLMFTHSTNPRTSTFCFAM